MKELLVDFLTGYESFRGMGRLIPLILASLLFVCFIYTGIKKGRRIHPAVFLLSAQGIIAYGATLCYEKAKSLKRLVRLLTCLLCIFAIILSGNYLLSSQYFHKVDNTMHVDNELIKVMDILLDASAHPKVIAPPSSSYYYRMYSSRFVTLYDFGSEIEELDGDAGYVYDELLKYEPDMGRIAGIARRKNIEFVVLDNERYWPEFPITRYGYDEYANTGKYTIYRREMKPEERYGGDEYE